MCLHKYSGHLTHYTTLEWKIKTYFTLSLKIPKVILLFIAKMPYLWLSMAVSKTYKYNSGDILHIFLRLLESWKIIF